MFLFEDDKMVSYKEFKTAFAMILFDMGARAMLRPAVHQLFHSADSNDDHMIDMNDYKAMIMKSDKDSKCSVLPQKLEAAIPFPMSYVVYVVSLPLSIRSRLLLMYLGVLPLDL